MNSYKKINQDIKVEDCLKQQTITLMTKSTKCDCNNRVKLTIGIAIVCLIICIPLFQRKESYKNEGKVNKDQSLVQQFASTDPFVFDDYLVDEAISYGKTGNGMVLKGGFEKMEDWRKAYFEQLLPRKDALRLPKYMQWIKTEFMEVRDELEKHYPMITYVFSSTDDHDQALSIKIQDEQLPQDIAWNMEQAYRYQSYLLKIKCDDDQMDWYVTAKKDGLLYEIIGKNISKKDFYMFLLSFLI